MQMTGDRKVPGHLRKTITPGSPLCSRRTSVIPIQKTSTPST